MRAPLIASFAVHAGLLAYALFWLPAVEAFKTDPQESIPVNIVSIEDFSKKMATTKAAEPKKVEKPKPKKTDTVKDVKPQEKVAPEEVKAAKEPAVKEPPPKPEKKPEPPKPEEPKPLDSKELAALLKEEPPPPEKKPEPKPEPKPVEKEKPKEPPPPDQAALDAVLKQSVDEQAEAEKQAAEEAAQEKADAEAKKKADASAKKAAEKAAKDKAAKEAKEKAAAEAKAAKKKAAEFDTTAVADLLNKIPDEAAAPEKTADDTGEPQVAERNDTGDDKELAATLGQALSSHLYDCWKVPPGAKDAAISVKVRFALNRDGTVRGQPQVVNNNDDPLFETTARSVISAIKRCETYEFLPRDKYDMWEQNTVNFRADQQPA